jgi:hypothetical protein
VASEDFRQLAHHCHSLRIRDPHLHTPHTLTLRLLTVITMDHQRLASLRDRVRAADAQYVAFIELLQARHDTAPPDSDRRHQISDMIKGRNPSTATGLSFAARESVAPNGSQAVARFGGVSLDCELHPRLMIGAHAFPGSQKNPAFLV